MAKHLILLLQLATILVQFANGNHLMTSDLYKELVKKESGNFLFCPFSLEVVLAVTNEGAVGETSQQLAKLLRLAKHKEDAQAQYKTILQQFNNRSRQYELLAVDKIYVADGLTLKKNFTDVATDVYKAETENINFANNVNASSVINKWVEKNTKSKIQNIVTPDNLGGSTKAVLINTLYFNGTWATQFDKSKTVKSTFFRPDNSSVDVDTMHFPSGSFYYGESQEYNAKFLLLPYKGENITMTIILPNESRGLAAIENQLAKAYLFDKFEKTRLHVQLPKFKIESTVEFIPILQDLGVKDVFNPCQADLSGIAGKKGDLYVSNIIQKTFVNVAETGTEAAAATAVSVTATAIQAPPKTSFIANHQFLFWIQLNDEILFTGRVADPKV